MAEQQETIPVKFSEDLAQYAEIRAVRHQPMTLHELVGLVLTTTGKQPARIQEILRRGTCTYNIYRYWWEGIELDAATLAGVLAEFPDPEPTRALRAEACAWILLVSADEPTPHTLLVEREVASRRRWLRRQSFWEGLLALAEAKAPAYREYSYYHRGDIYACALDTRDLERLEAELARLASRGLRQQIARAAWRELQLFCPRS